MVNRMRATRSHRNNRRSHHALENPATSLCGNCGAPRLQHSMCDVCGFYKGEKVIDMKAILEKKEAKNKKKEQKKA